MTKPLQQAFEYYLEHRGELMEKYPDQYVVINGCQILGVYDSEIAAVEETAEEHDLGSFLVQKCAPGEEMEFYHSRVAFA